ncbi:MAG: hypothetical protein HY903_07200 [Deltaproteobacteria bacterium]|nr:hypothetical protein [Deltaproteobacteria bacterium]
MKKIKALVVGSLLAAALAACAYGGAAASGDKVVVLRNDQFLLGALRAAFVCQITDTGLQNCQAGNAP